MSEISTEFASINKSLIDFQNQLAQLDNFRLQCERDISTLKQNVDKIYVQTIEQIENSRKLAEVNYTQKMDECKKKRNDIEIISQRSYSSMETNINNKYAALTKNYNAIISWITNAINTMPQKIIKKATSDMTIKPVATDIKQLQDLYNKINDDSFNAGVNRTFHMNGYLPKKKMITNFIHKSIAYKLYLENEIQANVSKKTKEIDTAYKTTQIQKKNDSDPVALQEQRAFQERTIAIKEIDRKRTLASDTKTASLSAIEEKKKKYDREIVRMNNDLTNKFNAYMNSDFINQFMERMKKRLAGTGAQKSDWSVYNPKNKFTQYYIGNIIRSASATEKKILSPLQNKLQNVFRNGLFKIPLLIKADAAKQFFIQYKNYDKKLICEFVQCIILQKLRCAAGNIEVYFAEPDKSGQILGPLSAPVHDNETIGIYNINSKDAIKASLKKFGDDIDEINGHLGNYQSIYDYNNNCKPLIKERCIVLVDVSDVLDKEDWELLKVIWNNGDRCGMTVIIVSAHSVNDISSLYPHGGVDVSYILSKDLYLIKCIDNKTTIKHGQSEVAFIMGKITDERRAFVDIYRKKASDFQKVDSKFSSYFDAAAINPYKLATDSLSLPVMLNNYPGGGQFEFIIDSKTRAHTLLTGGTGSGKTTFLYMLISYIVMSYHPDDVEIWLVDYGRVSFKKYVNTRPKHIRFVSLEKTDTFTYSFLEYVDAFFSNRARLFKHDNVDSISGYRALHGDLSMPRVVLIIDEFHVMPQHAKESPTHNKILENILREYRKYGLSCIFSDQTCNTGLTQDGAKQIANRLSMKQNNIRDIIETLDVEKGNFDQEQLRQMERTQQGELWMKAFNGESENDFSIKCFKTIYANDEDQKKVIETSLKRNDDVKCDTKIHIIDGEERKKISLRGLSSVLSTTGTSEPSFCMGVPTSIEHFFTFSLEQRYSNNILIAGRNTIIDNDVPAELLLSAVIKGNIRTIIFADPREKKLPEIKKILNGLHVTDKIEIYTDYKSICTAVRKFSEQLNRREVFKEPVFIMWLGILDIFDELAVYGGYNERLERTGKIEKAEENQTGFELSDEKNNKACMDEELQAMATQFGVSVEQMIEMLSGADETENKNANKDDDEECIYNAINDINLLLTMGGRYSLYNAVTLESAGDMKRLKDFKLDNFIHRIGYVMSSDDSWDFGFGRKASSIPEDDMVLYTNGIKNNIFRPFLLAQ